MTVRDPTPDAPTDLEQTITRTWFVGGIFVGFGLSPIAGLLVYALSGLFFDRSLSAVIVLMAAILSFALGLAYVALARELE